jgi:hypothetical protein
LFNFFIRRIYYSTTKGRIPYDFINNVEGWWVGGVGEGVGVRVWVRVGEGVGVMGGWVGEGVSEGG